MTDDARALAALTSRELLRALALARRAAARGRGRDPAGAVARLEAELERRRAARLDRAGDRAPAIEALDPQPSLFDAAALDPHAALRARWRDLVERRLPAAARARGWPIDQDHCFARVLLDNACGRPWRERIRPPAWANADAETLARAAALGEAALAGTADLAALNRRSLELREKTPPDARSAR